MFTTLPRGCRVNLRGLKKIRITVHHSRNISAASLVFKLLQLQQLPYITVAVYWQEWQEKYFKATKNKCENILVSAFLIKLVHWVWRTNFLFILNEVIGSLVNVWRHFRYASISLRGRRRPEALKASRIQVDTLRRRMSDVGSADLRFPPECSAVKVWGGRCHHVTNMYYRWRDTKRRIFFNR